MKYRKKTREVDVVKVSWKNWSEICNLLGDVLSSTNPAVITNSCVDSCGENPPYMRIRIPTEYGEEFVRHGEYLIKDNKGNLKGHAPCTFNHLYEKSEDNK